MSIQLFSQLASSLGLVAFVAIVLLLQSRYPKSHPQVVAIPVKVRENR